MDCGGTKGILLSHSTFNGNCRIWLRGTHRGYSHLCVRHTSGLGLANQVLYDAGLYRVSCSLQLQVLLTAAVREGLATLLSLTSLTPPAVLTLWWISSFSQPGRGRQEQESGMKLKGSSW